MRNLFSAVAVAVSMSLSAPAIAAPLSASELLHQFNLITFGGFQTSSEVEGRTYVGGSLTGAAATFNTRSTPPSDYDALVVVGNVSGGDKNINGGGNASVGSNAANMNMNGGTLFAGGTASAVSGNQQSGLAGTAGFADRFPSDVASVLMAASAATAALDGGTPDTQLEGKRYILDASKGPFSLSLSDIGSANVEFEYRNVSLANPLIVNVSGTGSLLSKFVGADLLASAPFVLWNFFEAQMLHIQSQWFGTILAPLAHVTNATNIEGTLVAASASLSGEMHVQPFRGDIPTIPVPATLPLIASALVGLALLRRRGRAAA